jgi:hypothetical protein
MWISLYYENLWVKPKYSKKTSPIVFVFLTSLIWPDLTCAVAGPVQHKSVFVITGQWFVLRKYMFQITWYQSLKLLTHNITNPNTLQVFCMNMVFRSMTYEILQMTLNPLFLLVHDWISHLLTQLWSGWFYSVSLECRWFSLFFLTINLWYFPTVIETNKIQFNSIQFI